MTYTKRNKQQAIIFSDSIAKPIQMREFNNHIEDNVGVVKLAAFPGATAKLLNHYVLPTLQDTSPETVIIHVGINNILHKGKMVEPDVIAKEIANIGLTCKDYKVKNIFISNILYSTKADINSIRVINEKIGELCECYGFTLIDNSEVEKGHLWKDGIHLNDQGIKLLADNYINILNEYFLDIGPKSQQVT